MWPIHLWAKPEEPLNSAVADHAWLVPEKPPASPSGRKRSGAPKLADSSKTGSGVWIPTGSQRAIKLCPHEWNSRRKRRTFHGRGAQNRHLMFAFETTQPFALTSTFIKSALGPAMDGVQWLHAFHLEKMHIHAFADEFSSQNLAHLASKVWNHAARNVGQRKPLAIGQSGLERGTHHWTSSVTPIFWVINSRLLHPGPRREGPMERDAQEDKRWVRGESARWWEQFGMEHANFLDPFANVSPPPLEDARKQEDSSAVKKTLDP